MVTTKPVEYTGVQINIRPTGQYINGKFVQFGTTEKRIQFTIYLSDKQRWVLTGNGEHGIFETVDQAKAAVRYAYGSGFKWTVTKRT